MSQYKICVYAISKNEEQFVDRWMDAVSEADLVVVTDTGSTDRTVEKLKARGAVVYQETIEPWRFDAARNKAMDHIPKDVDICVSTDLDEIFDPSWREKLEAAWQPDTTSAKYLFTWSYKDDGTPDKQFTMEKIHSRKGFRWVHPVHEFIEYKYPHKAQPVWVNGLVLNHYPDLSKPRSQYLPLLELSANENPEDAQTIFWLGREYMYYGKYDECIDTMEQYLELPTAAWNEERSAAMRFIATCCQTKGDTTKARVWLFKAIAECPHIREPYLQMAQLGYQEQDWPLVFYMVNEALKITSKTGSYLLDPACWGYSLYDLGAISSYWLEMYQKAYEFAIKAFEMEPSDTRLKNNLELIKLKVT